MKKYIFFISLMIVGFACSDTDEISQPDNALPTHVKQAMADYAKRLSKPNKRGMTNASHCNNCSLEQLFPEYDFTRAQLQTVNNSSGAINTLVVPWKQNRPTAWNLPQKFMGFYIRTSDNVIQTHGTTWVMMKNDPKYPHRSNVQGNFKSIQHYNAYDELLLSGIMRRTDDDWNWEVKRFGDWNSPADCGETVAECIDDFYTGHGWGSVGLGLTSLIFPEIFVGVAGGCMLSCATGVIGPD